MRSTSPFIGVDWGTSRMRAMLCSFDEPTPQNVVVGEGIMRLKKSFSTTLFDAIGGWEQEYGKLDIAMAGMVGSNLGWRKTDYVSCPLEPSELLDHSVSFVERGHNVTVLPGVSCTNSLGEPDVMRGEELQILGWASNHALDTDDVRLICLPGTHTKWVSISGKRVQSFTTSFTGELYAMLIERSTLLANSEVVEPQRFDSDSFLRGVKLVRREKNALLHALFSARARWLIDGDRVGDVASYLSGMLIGSDIECALSHSVDPGTKIEIIGEPDLCKKFEVAIRNSGHTCSTSDGLCMSYSGFLSLMAQAD